MRAENWWDQMKNRDAIISDKIAKSRKYLSALAAEALLVGQYDGRKGALKPIDRAEVTTSVSEGDRIIVSVASISTQKIPKTALLEIKFLDNSGAEIEFVWPRVSTRLGAFQYLEVESIEKHATTQFAIDAPPGAVSLKVSGRTWNRYVRTVLVGDITVQNLNRPSEEPPQSDVITYAAKYLFMKRSVPDGASTIQVAVDHIAAGEQSSNPIIVRLRDANGDELMPPSKLAQHPEHGAYFPLNGGKGKLETTEIVVDIPHSAVSIELEGLDWGKKSAVICGVPTLTPKKSVDDEIQDFLEQIPAGDQLFIIDTTAPPLGHPTLSLRPNNLSVEYEKLGIWVIFLPFGSLQEFSARVSEKIMQVPRQRFQSLIELVDEHRAPGDSVFVCSSFPNFQSVTACTHLKSKGWTIIYECRDDMEEFNRVGYSKWYTQELERYILDVADRVVAVSPSLLEKLRDMSPQDIEGRVIPNGVNDQTLASGAPLRKAAALEDRNNHRVVGYVGHLTSSWFDWPAVIHAAMKLPDVTFQIVGHGLPDNLTLPPNIEFLGPKTHEELRDIVPFWRVGLIPFQDMPLTRSVDPNKIYEYFAWGLRCVTTQMGSVETYPSTWVYSGRDHLVESISRALSTPIDTVELQAMEDFASQCSWFERAKEMHSYITAQAAPVVVGN